MSSNGNVGSDTTHTKSDTTKNQVIDKVITGARGHIMVEPTNQSPVEFHRQDAPSTDGPMQQALQKLARAAAQTQTPQLLEGDRGHVYEPGLINSVNENGVLFRNESDTTKLHKKTEELHKQNKQGPSSDAPKPALEHALIQGARGHTQAEPSPTVDKEGNLHRSSLQNIPAHLQQAVADTTKGLKHVTHDVTHDPKKAVPDSGTVAKPKTPGMGGIGGI